MENLLSHLALVGSCLAAWYAAILTARRNNPPPTDYLPIAACVQLIKKVIDTKQNPIQDQ